MFEQTNQKVWLSNVSRHPPGGFQTGQSLFTRVTQTGRVSSFPDPSSLSLINLSLSLAQSAFSSDRSPGDTHTRALAVMSRASDAITVSQTKTNPNTIQLSRRARDPALSIYIFILRSENALFVMAKQNMSVLEPQEKLMEALGQTVSALMLNAG